MSFHPASGMSLGPCKGYRDGYLAPDKKVGVNWVLCMRSFHTFPIWIHTAEILIVGSLTARFMLTDYDLEEGIVAY